MNDFYINTYYKRKLYDLGMIKDDVDSLSENLSPLTGKLDKSKDTLEILNFLFSISTLCLIEGIYKRIGLQ